MNNIKDLLGSPPSANVISEYLERLSDLVSATDSLIPEVKSYSDIVYFNYVELGISLQFSPCGAYRPANGLVREQLNDDCLQLEAVDIYNVPSVKLGGTTRSVFSTHPCSPLKISLETCSSSENAPGTGATSSVITIARDTTGKDFVSWLGEPSRKGGGTGPSTGSIGIWCEWCKQGIMVEFGGDEARGPQAWERGKDAIWRVITIFSPK
ncbi:hypothetical protein PAXRUDRAFT_15817 [Paxillus rubicundulus Ve08.2h10]|uniref:Uncharacterized protein n=1 Tax=Paxillus rubicundulus Ve08.2h10 TaxID=930991 RepID=A0A0D0DGK9_9AGAM|nr:hypothetical protein PAXRUDRAFT_15817 [Paxillus rubicundulus Ve08.2h10]